MCVCVCVWVVPPPPGRIQKKGGGCTMMKESEQCVAARPEGVGRDVSEYRLQTRS